MMSYLGYKSLLEKNLTLFAGGKLDQEAKDDFSKAVMKAYIKCKNKIGKTYERKNKSK